MPETDENGFWWNPETGGGYETPQVMAERLDMLAWQLNRLDDEREFDLGN